MSIWQARCNTVTTAIIFFTIIDHTSKWMELFLFPLFLRRMRTFFNESPDLGYPKRSLQIAGRNLLQIFRLSYAICLTFCIAIPPLSTLRQMVQLKDCIAAANWDKEIPWVLLGLCSQTKVVFGTCLVLPNDFLKAEEFSVDQIKNFVSKILVAPDFSLPSKHNSGHQLPEEPLGTSCVPPLSGCIAPASSRPCSGPMTAPMPSCIMAPAPSPFEWGPGTRLSPSAGSSLAKTQMLNQAVHYAAANHPAPARWPSQPPPAAAVHPHPGGSCFQAPGLYTLTPGAAEWMPGNGLFPTWGFFNAPGQLLLPQPLQHRYPQPKWRPPARIDLWPCLLRG